MNTAKRMRLDNSNIGSGSGTGKTNSTSANINKTHKECSICKAVFNNNIGLSNHMRSHQFQNSMLSQSSSFKISTNSLLNNSRTSLTASNILRGSLEQPGDRRFRRMRCRICQRRFSTKKSYRYHMLHDHQIRNVHFIKCQMCDAEFAYEKGLKVHMFKVHNTLLKDEMIIKQYECEICSTVYSNDVELQQHLTNAHGKTLNKPAKSLPETAKTNDFRKKELSAAEIKNATIGSNVNGSCASIDTIPPGASLLKSSKEYNQTGAAQSSTPINMVAPPLYWYQCKYCPSNFNTNKKLAIHINSHDEFDSSDYSCKDCGNVYSGRKSLWVKMIMKYILYLLRQCLMRSCKFFQIGSSLQETSPDSRSSGMSYM